MVPVKATAESERGAPPEPGLLAADAAGLQPGAAAKRIAFDRADCRAIDGPFAAITERVAGYPLRTMADLDHAVAWARRCPGPMPEPSVIELRPLNDEADVAL